MKASVLFCGRLSKLFAALCLVVGCLAAPVCAQQEDPAANTTRLIEEYGDIGDCDETARLDNFAVTLQNEPESRGHIIVYAGKKDLPGWLPGMRRRPHYYLVEMRGLEAARLEVVFGGYREKRATELWILRAGDVAPMPSRTIEVTREADKAFQFISTQFDFEYEDEAQSEEADESASADETNADENQSAENAAEADVTDADAATADESSEPESGAESADDDFMPAAGESDEETKREASKVVLNWNPKSYVEALKNEPDARACLIVYYDPLGINFKKVQEAVEEVKKKLVEQYGLKAEQIVTLPGGDHAWPQIEFWIVPKGGELPVPKAYEPEAKAEEPEETKDQ